MDEEKKKKHDHQYSYEQEKMIEHMRRDAIRKEKEMRKNEKNMKILEELIR